MSHDLPRRDESVSPTEFVEINRTCERFESAWRAGQTPTIERYLGAAVEPVRSELFRELLATELELRQAAGERPATAR